MAALAIIATGGCHRPSPAVPVDRAPSAVIDVPRADATGSSVEREVQRTDRWSRAYSNDPLASDLQRALMSEAAQSDGYSAAFALGRRTSLAGLEGVLGTLPPQQTDAFLRGLAGRPWGALPLPLSWRLRWSQDPPSAPLAALFAKNPVGLDAVAAARGEELLLHGDVVHQVVGARSLQNASIPLPSLASLQGLHPVAFPIAVKALALHGAVPTDTWTALLATIATRAHLNPRSWGGAWISLMDAVPNTDPTVQGALIGLEPIVTQAELQPVGVRAAYRCALALRFDRLDQGHRTETCAAGTDSWRSLVALAERARPPLPPALVAEQLRGVIARGQSDPRVLEAVAQAAVLLPPPQGRSVILQIADSHDPGVLVALLEGLRTNLTHARLLPPATLNALLRAPFDLPEAPALEARQQAIELSRALILPSPAVSTTVRALQRANTPDGGTAPQASVASAPGTAGTLVLETTAGTIRIALRSDTAPEALNLFLETARAGSYRQTTFHRVVPGFVAQGGDPRGDGYGGTNRITPTELSGGRFERGAVGVALAGLDTGGTQFFITLTDSPSLDARYPYLGRVIAGIEVVDRLMTGDEIVNVGFVPPEQVPSEP